MLISVLAWLSQFPRRSLPRSPGPCASSRNVIPARALYEATPEMNFLRNRTWMDRCTGLLVLVSMAVAGFMASLHDLVPMWIEGMPQYEHQILAALGYAKWTGGCEALVIQGHCFPLSLNAYIGAVITYLDMPASYFWLSGLSDDPYLYRYTSIFALLASGWFFYGILRWRYGNAWAFYGSVIFLFSPIELLVGLTDHRTFLIQTMLLMAMFFFGVCYRKSRHPGYLWVCCLAGGLTLWSRTEAFVLPILSLVLYGLLFRRQEVAHWWAALTGRHLLLGGALLSFVAGAIPVLAFNISCPENGLLQFLLHTSVPNMRSGSVGQNLLVRLRQFFTFNLLNQFPLFEIHIRNIVLAGAFFATAVVVLGHWCKSRKADYPLFALGILLPMYSLLRSGGFREVHLHMLQPAVIAVVISGCARLLEGRRCLTHAILWCVAVGSGVVTVGNWRAWQSASPTDFTLLNQSDPSLLVSYLKENHSADELFFTNIGLEQYVEYVSRGNLKGRDIVNWSSAESFEVDVRLALLGSARRRVFVAVSPEHDGMEGTLPRTRLLYGVLKSTGVSYRTVRLKNPKNPYLYDLVVVERGVAPLSSPDHEMATGMISEIGLNPVHDGVITGTIYGTGFQTGDTVIVDGGATYPTAYGSERFITFAIPEAELRGKRALRIEILRPSTMGRSRPFQLLLSGPPK